MQAFFPVKWKSLLKKHVSDWAHEENGIYNIRVHITL
jgi:hypothetical protein